MNAADLDGFASASVHAADPAPWGQPLHDRRQLLLAGLLLACGAAAVGLRPRRQFARLSAAAMAAAIPNRVAGWEAVAAESLIAPPSDELTAKLYDQVLMRSYQNVRGQRVGLCLAYGGAQDGDLQLHRPDECYPAQGFAISGKHYVPMALAGNGQALHLSATALTATRFDRTEQLLYWTRIAGAFPVESRDERAVIFAENLSGRMPDGLLLRLSTTSNDAAPALALMQDFAAALFAALGPPGRQILLGRAG